VQALPVPQPAQGLADRLRALADDTGAREHLRQAARGLGLENGLDVAVDALGTLAGFN
jgi:hypothetical protein